MKIIPALQVIQGQKAQTARKGVRAAVRGHKEPSGGPAEIVCLENKRAAQTAPRTMAEAEGVLETLTRDLGQLSPEDLRSMHRLEGLVQVFQV